MKKLPTRTQKNPFEYGRELIGGELVDRRDELLTVQRALTGGGKLFLIGPRRYGKTSLLATAQANAEVEGAIVLRFDAERFASLDALAQALLTAAGSRMATTVEKASEIVKRLGGSLIPAVTYDVEKNEWSVSLGARDKANAKPLPILIDVLDTIERMAAESERTVAVVIDEFQEVVQNEGLRAEKQLRSAIQQHRHVSYVFAGSATRMLADMTGNSNRPFYKLGARLFLKAIPRDEFAVFLTDGFTRFGFACAGEAIDRILDAAEEVPYSVQRLANACWEATRTSADLSLTPERVDATVALVAAQEDSGYTQLWLSLKGVQKNVMVAVVEESGYKLMGMSVLKRLNVPLSTMRGAIKALGAHGLLRQEEHKGIVHYRLLDPLFGRWLEWAGQAKKRTLAPRSERDG